MGLGYIYFVVLSPSGFQVIVEPYAQAIALRLPVPDPVYVTQSLLPSLVHFWYQVVLPAFEERDVLGKDNLVVGWLPPTARKRMLQDASAS